LYDGRVDARFAFLVDGYRFFDTRDYENNEHQFYAQSSQVRLGYWSQIKARQVGSCILRRSAVLWRCRTGSGAQVVKHGRHPGILACPTHLTNIGDHKFLLFEPQEISELRKREAARDSTIEDLLDHVRKQDKWEDIVEDLSDKDQQLREQAIGRSGAEVHQ
jgi:hypothetical protein